MRTTVFNHSGVNSYSDDSDSEVDSDNEGTTVFNHTRINSYKPEDNQIRPINPAKGSDPMEIPVLSACILS